MDSLVLDCAQHPDERHVVGADGQTCASSVLSAMISKRCVMSVCVKHIPATSHYDSPTGLDEG